MQDKARGGRLYGWNKGPTRQRHTWAQTRYKAQFQGLYMNVKDNPISCFTLDINGLATKQAGFYNSFKKP